MGVHEIALERVVLGRKRVSVQTESRLATGPRLLVHDRRRLVKHSGRFVASNQQSAQTYSATRCHSRCRQSMPTNAYRGALFRAATRRTLLRYCGQTIPGAWKTLGGLYSRTSKARHVYLAKTASLFATLVGLKGRLNSRKTHATFPVCKEKTLHGNKKSVY